MKRTRLWLGVLAFAFVLIPALVQAQGAPAGLPGWGWWTGMTVQNVSPTRAVIWAAAVPAAPVTPSPTPLPPSTAAPPPSYLAYQYDPDYVDYGESVTFLPADFPNMQAGSFEGAGIINST